MIKFFTIGVICTRENNFTLNLAFKKTPNIYKNSAIANSCQLCGTAGFYDQ